MGQSRRRTLQILGGGVILAAGAAGGWALTRDPAGARIPWKTAGRDEGDPVRRALSYAILAPNPHNMQPWLVEIESPRAATLYCDLDRRLPATDPYDRQIVIGLGAFLETLRIAAAEDGRDAVIAAFPQGADETSLDARPVARIRLDDGGEKDPLFAEILRRRTDRSPFDRKRSVEAEALAAIAMAGSSGAARAEAFIDAGRVEALRDLARRAWLVEIETPRTWRESIDVTRIGRREIEAAPDGLSLAGPLIEGLNAAGVLTREKMADPSHTAFVQSRDFMSAAIDTATGFAVIATQGNSRLDQLAAGAAYMRMNLEATARGVSMHPLSQALQEYPEMADLYAEAHELLALPGETAQMLARIGYGRGAPPAPRWPLEAKLRKA